MIAVISPAKTLDFATKPCTKTYSQPAFLPEAAEINKYLKQLGPPELEHLQGISLKLAELNVHRNRIWQPPFSPDNAKQAVLAFNGDVYEGMDASSFSEKEFQVAQKKIRILSGLYGVLKPLDLIQPYRLEMGTKFGFESYSDLYEFWQEKITKAINEEVKGAEGKGILINLASHEYFKAVDTRKIEGKVITPVFKDNKNGQYKIISFFAKKARGLMCRFIVKNKISDPLELQAFDLEGYYFNSHLTKGDTWVFTRG